MTACNITKVVPKGEQLLVRNKIVRGESNGVDLSDEKDNMRQKPNRELFGFVKFHLWAYQYGNKGLGIAKKQSKLRSFAEKIGEAPVLIDSNMVRLSSQKLSDYYFSKGFLDNEVSYKIIPKKWFSNRARVFYLVNLEKYHRINSVEYNVSSRAIDLELVKSTNQQKLKIGQRLDFENVESERERIKVLLRNNGFYYFNSSFIDFQIDTNQSKLYADIAVNIRSRKNFEPHYQQRLNTVTVTIGDVSGVDSISYDDLTFLEGSYYIKPSVLAKNIKFRPGELYSAGQVQKTYSNLLSMGLFNFVTIRFFPSQDDSLQLLDVQIILQTAPKHDFTWEPQGIFTDRSDIVSAGFEKSFGIANNFTLLNRNVFGGAEMFNISSITALETQIKGDKQGFFNIFRQSVNTELVIPSLLFFNKSKFTDELERKNTRISVSYLHDRNANYTRNVVPLSFSYSFIKNGVSYGITPFRLSVNQAVVDPSFLVNLDPSTFKYTVQLLTNNIIAGPTASFYWNNKDKNIFKYWQVRSNAVELSGNLASLYFNTLTEKTGINKEIFGVKYSQYARGDIDVVFNHIIDENNSLAYRGYLGAGLPYGNTKFLPFERRFFVGGGNSLRAWRPRTIGPGSYNDSSSLIAIEKTGEIMLQANAEYRFDIIDKYIDGAIFLDAGNIWNFRENVRFPNAEFELDRFYKELAINSGLGLRFDFTYVVFRTDWGIALHDPSKVMTNRWVVKDFFSSGWINDNTAINFAVGFPF